MCCAPLALARISQPTDSGKIDVKSCFATCVAFTLFLLLIQGLSRRMVLPLLSASPRRCASAPLRCCCICIPRTLLGITSRDYAPVWLPCVALLSTLVLSNMNLETRWLVRFLLDRWRLLRRKSFFLTRAPSFSSFLCDFLQKNVSSRGPHFQARPSKSTPFLLESPFHVDLSGNAHLTLVHCH